MVLNKIAEILKADGTSEYKNVTDQPNINLGSLNTVYTYTAAQRSKLEDTLNYLGLQELYPNLKTAEAFVYLTSNAPLENLQKEAEENGTKLVGYLEIFTVPGSKDVAKQFEG